MEPQHELEATHTQTNEPNSFQNYTKQEPNWDRAASKLGLNWEHNGSNWDRTGTKMTRDPDAVGDGKHAAKLGDHGTNLSPGLGQRLDPDNAPVSYTHLTLPTIYSV